MPGPIPQAFIDEVVNRIDIVELIDSRVNLKKAGKEYTACCPFHSEKTPSFTVSPQKQFYHCFGCQAHGTAISFLMDYDHLSFVEAIEELAHILGLEVPRETGINQPQDKHKPLYDILEKVADFYQQQLRKHPAASTAVDYLKNRGLSGDIALDFRVGFAPPGWNQLCDIFTSESDRKTLVEAGLLVEKENKQYYDRFRNRVMFPILDRRGRVIAFGGRVIAADDKPKYLNSPETAVFHKSRELYGFFEARNKARVLKRFLVVEGYMDVVALAQFDINYAVATLGTSTSKEHIETLYRSVSDIVFCFDGDAPGRKAAWRAMENSLGLIKQGRQLSFLFLPDGEDPDSMIRKEGKSAFELRIESAMPLSEFIINSLAESIDITRIDGKARFIEQFKPLATKLPDELFRELLIVKIAEHLNADQELIIRSLQSNNSIIKNETQPVKTPGQSNFRLTQSRTPVRSAIAILLQYPNFAIQVENSDNLLTLKLPGIEILYKLIEILKTDPNLKSSTLLERFRGTDDHIHLGKLAKLDLPGNQESLQHELTDILDYFKQLTVDQRWSLLQQKLTQEGLNETEKMEYRQLLERHSATDN